MTPLTILLGTYQGAAHLQAQLDSFTAQTHRDWRLVIGDDGSRDATRDIAAAFRDREGRPPRIVPGPGRGFAANFLGLLCDPAEAPGHVALSDQDDVWFPDKLERAMALLAQADPAIPALACGRTLLTDAALRPLGPSRRHRHFAFGNALVQNVVAGNTIVMNPAAHRLLRAAGPQAVPYHDWWCYLLVTGAGGRILYDPVPCMQYRQHGGNVQGENLSAGAVMRRARDFGGRKWRGWFEANIAALEANRHLLTGQNRARLDAFLRHDRRNAAGRARALLALAPWRQRPAETAALYGGTLLGLS
ncbi:glycosyltransferase [Mangrovicoccus algicola]|uniref:Glycosyltransferase n=1 Tax=Mangrovicoccus algicola TaxID=2771008 RepID=A0A8J6YW74_9RHOB|nr:glycosyltransferase [Mangrovicoccus algicola]MBE3639010.1 glycosyltransferase [Mangrovicoccus algicola]